MRAELFVHIRHYDAEVEVQREFDLDFAPYPGMKMVFPVIQNNHPNAEQFQAVLKDSAPVTGIFDIDGVYYNPESRTFRMTAYQACESAETLDTTAEQLVLGYGFVRS